MVCGLLCATDLPTSVAAFILHAASLLGIDSVIRVIVERQAACKGSASDLERGKLAAATSEIGLAPVVGAARDLVEGRNRGRLGMRTEQGTGTDVQDLLTMIRHHRA